MHFESSYAQLLFQMFPSSELFNIQDGYQDGSQAYKSELTVCVYEVQLIQLIFQRVCIVLWSIWSMMTFKMATKTHHLKIPKFQLLASFAGPGLVRRVDNVCKTK